MTPSRIDVAKKYAVAYIHVFKHDIDSTVLDNLQRAVYFLSNHKNMLFLLSLYETTAEEKGRIILQFITAFNLPASLQRLMNLLLQNKDICMLADVLRDVYCFAKKEFEIEDVMVSSSSPVSLDDQEVLLQFFGALAHKKCRITIKQDAELIAGIRIQSDTWLWEHSVAKNMKKLRFDLLKKV
jgi:F0F1-type ATP synthase delta subunit